MASEPFPPVLDGDISQLSAQEIIAAEKSFRATVARDPGNALAHDGLARIHLNRQEWREALFHAREALRLDPSLEPGCRTTIVRAERNISSILLEPTVAPWFADRNVTRYPDRKDDYADLSTLIEKHVLPGWLPDRPPFGPHSRIVTLGSCFAGALRTYLMSFGYESEGLWVPEALNNTFALRQFIDWSVAGILSDDAYWYDADEQGRGRKWLPSHEQASYRKMFEAAAGIVITVGLAEVWQDLETGGIFWRGVPRALYEPGRYRCRMSTIEENEANLRRIVTTLRSLGDQRPIIFTLSPIPLLATFQKTSCVVMDCVSKSILRVAIANVCESRLDGVFYWPSFEIVRWVGSHIPTSMFGDDARDERHIAGFVAPLIMKHFIKHYFVEPARAASADELKPRWAASSLTAQQDCHKSTL
ncbi:MAG TPA: GSCFA domain-containing protein [Stellaceae bacterium]|nr:GSCFA domain-containing protein [Stellaceae bacterium]